MLRIVYLGIALFVCHISGIYAQNNDSLIDRLFSGRECYVATIPEKFRYHYNSIVETGNRSIIDTLKKIIPDKALSNTGIYVMEEIPVDRPWRKNRKIWTKDFIISYRWNSPGGKRTQPPWQRYCLC